MTLDPAAEAERLIARSNDPNLNGHREGATVEQVPPRRTLEFVSYSDLVARVDSAPPRTFLVEPLWAAGTYGALGAEDKAGKTWANTDLAVSVATGTPWLGRFPTVQGNVTLFLGEGGDAGMRRRIGAILEGRELSDADLGEHLRLCFRVPHLKDEAHLQEVRSELTERPASLVCLDPLYLAARGAKGSDLYAMGEHLEPLQLLCEEAGSALCVVHHWNKTGVGSGAQRFTGVGPSAWGRVLGSAAVESRKIEADGRTSRVQLRWEFVGGDIPEQQFRMVRRVWSDDPTDLSSPLHYEVSVTDEGPDIGTDASLGRTEERVLAAMNEATETDPTTVGPIGDRLATDGKGAPLQKRTINRTLARLQAAGMVDGEDDGPGRPGRWWVL